MEHGFDLEEMLKVVYRRDELSNHMPKCPSCRTLQVQLVGYVDVHPAQWKCRHCKFEFEYENGVYRG